MTISFILMINSLLRAKTAAEIASDLLVSQPTLARWSRGKNLPHPALRDGVFRYFEKTLEEYLERVKKRMLDNKPTLQ